MTAHPRRSLGAIGSIHRIDGQLFQIHVCPVDVAAGRESFARFFVACVSRLDDGAVARVCDENGRREIYGVTETWALNNARSLLDAGKWRDSCGARQLSDDQRAARAPSVA